MKKIISTLFLAAALFITSCGAAGPELLAFIDESSAGEVDYGGVEIIISSEKSGQNEEETYWSTVLRYDTNTMYGEAVLARYADIEKTIGVKLTNTREDDTDAVRLKLMAGTYIADILCYTGFGGMQNLAAAGLLLPLTNFEFIDLSETEKYGGANVLEGGMINSVPYAVQPISWPRWEACGITSMVYNLDILEQNSIMDPHEFWETENWYWDTFEETYLKGVTLSSPDEWVVSSSDKLFYYGFSYSNDVQYVTANADGDYVVDPKPQALHEALQEGIDWIRDYGDKIELFSDFWGTETFDAGNALFAVTSPNYSDGTTEIRASVMPFPCGPSCEYGYWPQAFDRIEGFGIPITSEEPEIAAHVMSLLFEPLDDYLGPIEDYYKNYVFNTELDAEIYMELIADARYDYTFDGGSDLMRGVNNNFSSAIKTGKSPSETVETYSGAIMRIMEEHVLPNFDYMYKNFYSLQNAD